MGYPVKKVISRAPRKVRTVSTIDNPKNLGAWAPSPGLPNK